MHHVHISTEFMFLGGLIFVALVAVICAFVVSMRRAKYEAKRPLLRVEDRPWTVADPFPGQAFPNRAVHDNRHRSFGGGYAPAPAAAPYMGPAVVHTGNGGADLLTGMLLGEAIAGGHHHDTYRETTVVHDSAPSSSSSSSSSSSDSGFSWGSSGGDSGGSSYDSGSSFGGDSGGGGGFDASF